MTETNLADPAQITEKPSTAGMTTKVVKGSLWTLAGQVLPLFASLATTPMIIRLLGNEGYGVLILITLIPTYFSFSELGMGVASTRFASEAYGRGNLGEEGRTIRTAARNRIRRSPLAFSREFILSLACDSAQCRDVLTGNSHMTAGNCAGKSFTQHRVGNRAVSETIAPSCAGQ